MVRVMVECNYNFIGVVVVIEFFVIKWMGELGYYMMIVEFWSDVEGVL